MQRMLKTATVLSILLVSTLGVQARYPEESASAPAAGDKQLWRETIDRASHGDFPGATKAIEALSGRGEIIDQVRTWLKNYEAEQDARRQLNQADFQKYVDYAKARIDRKEYRKALDWTLAAYDCAADRDAFLKSDWLTALVNDAIVAARGFRQEQDWEAAWHVYSRLAALFEREPRYQKLEREVINHLRFEAMFKEDSHWDERIEHVRWEEAKSALHFIERHYVEKPNFKEITEAGLEQLLLLAESKAAQERFEGLADDLERQDFEARVNAHLKQVRAAPAVDREECAWRFERVVTDINPQTIRLPEELIVSELMRGALDPLDEFTTVIWPQDSKEFEKHTRGNFVGVGISIYKNRKGEVEVVTPLEDTPAYRAGIQAGDVITKVDGEAIADYTINKVVDTITGQEGTNVTLTIRRDGKEIDFPLRRAEVKIRSVKGMQRDPIHEEKWDYWLDRKRGIAYIRVTNFQRNTVEDVDNALSELGAEGLEGLILDLRSNPGGLLDSAWQLTSRFLKRGDVVVSTRGRIKSEDQTFGLHSNGAYSELPLIVLVDGRSASASEIVSGAVRDNHRGLVIGERTFGKFSVQNLIPLGRTGEAKLKITTARYYLPSGVSLHRDPDSDEWGVKPDIPVRLVRKETSNVRKLWRESNLLGPAKHTADEAGADEDDDSPAADVEEPGQEENDETAKAGRADEKEKDEEEAKLPPLEQPDENLYPDQDPQLDTALLVMRLMLLGNSHPTFAKAETERPQETAQP